MNKEKWASQSRAKKGGNQPLILSNKTEMEDSRTSVELQR